MGENAELTLSRSTILILSSVLILVLLLGLTLDDIAQPGTFSRQLLTFSGVGHATGWAAPSPFEPTIFRPAVVNAAMPFGAVLMSGVVVSILTMRLFLARLIPLSSAAFLGASIYALLLYSAPMRSGIIAAAACLPLLLHFMNRGALYRTLLMMVLCTGFNADLLTSFLIAVACSAFEQKQRPSVRFAPLAAFFATVGATPDLRAQWRAVLSLFAPSTIAPEALGWVSPDFHQHPQAALVLGVLLFLRSRSERPLGKSDLYLLFATPCYLLFASALPLFAAAAAYVFTLEVSDWERKDPRARQPHWSVISMVAIISAAIGFSLSQVHAPWAEIEAVRQLRAQLLEEQPRGRMLADIRFGTALLSAGFLPFLDARAELYSSSDPSSVTGSALSDYAEIARLRPRWEQVLDRYGFKVALLPDNGPLVAALKARRHWREIGAGGSWVERERGQRQPRYLALLVAPD